MNVRKFLLLIVAVTVVFGGIAYLGERQVEEKEKAAHEQRQRDNLFRDNEIARARIARRRDSLALIDLKLKEARRERYEAGKAARKKREREKQASTSTLHWHDPKFNSRVTIKKVGGTYYLQDFLGKHMLETWHSSVPRYGHKNIRASGRIFTMVDRIGEPNIYYVLTETGSLNVYLNCEFGPCSYSRTMRRRHDK